MKIKTSKIVEQMPPSGIRTFFDLVLGMKDVISLGVGEPDFVSPWHIREKAIYSLEQGYTSYTSNKGMPELRKQIVSSLKHRYGISYDYDDQVLITVGVSEALDLALRAVLNPGDKVLIPQPSYVSYGPLTSLAGGVPVFIETKPENGFKLTPQRITKAYQKGTRVLLLNYPCNPTGASYSRKELNALVAVIKKLDLLVITDEVYDELTYDFEHTPFVTLKGMKERTVYLNGVSKSFAMTGFRIGWACGPQDVIAAMTKIHQYTMLCAPIISQLASMEALKNGFKSVQTMKREYQRRRRYIVDALNEIGLTCHMPEGTFYVFPSIESLGVHSLDFAKNLLKKEKVALIPGVAFGDAFKNSVRISYASAYGDLKEAIARITRYIETHTDHGKKKNKKR